MAEHDVQKIVDDGGEVFNFRDPTKQPVADRVTSWSSTPSDTKYPSEKLVKTKLNEIEKKAYGAHGFISSSNALAEVFAERTLMGTWSLNNRNSVRVQLYRYADGDEDNATLVWDSNTATGDVKESFLNARQTGTLLTTDPGECAKVVYTGSTSSYLRAIGIYLNVKVVDSSHTVSAYLRIGTTNYPTYTVSTYGSLVTAVASDGASTSATVIFKPNQSTGKMRFYGFRCLNTYSEGGTLIGTADKALTLYSSRKLAVSLSNTNTDTSFNGSADVTNIKTTGTLGVSNGGTGQTSLANVTVGAADKPTGFSARSTSATWGRLTPTNAYTTVTRWDTASGGSVVFADKSAQTSMQIDGYFYQSEGRYQVLDTSSTLDAAKVSGTVATATTASDYNTSSGTIKTVLDGKKNKIVAGATSFVNNNTNYDPVLSVTLGTTTTYKRARFILVAHAANHGDGPDEIFEVFLGTGSTVGQLADHRVVLLTPSSPTSQFSLLNETNYKFGYTWSGGVATLWLRCTVGDNARSKIFYVLEEESVGDSVDYQPMSTATTTAPSGLTDIDLYFYGVARASALNGVGSATNPVYVDANGQVQACSDLVKAVTSIDTSTMDSNVLYVM